LTVVGQSSEITNSNYR